MSRADDFIEQILPHALAAQEKYGVPASLTIAQAAVETGWGQHVKGNNYFGIKAGKSWDGETIRFNTHEVFDGNRVAMPDNFRAYMGIEESVMNYAHTLANHSEWKKDLSAAQGDSLKTIEGMQSGSMKYATAPTYTKLISNVITSRDLAQYDVMKPTVEAANDGILLAENSADAVPTAPTEKEAHTASFEPRTLAEALVGLLYVIVSGDVEFKQIDELSSVASLSGVTQGGDTAHPTISNKSSDISRA